MSPPNLREQRRSSTRREIAAAALDLVLERGLAEVTVEDIAKAAGISPRTFFNYFPSKKSAVVAGPEPLSAEAIEVFVADRDTPVLDGLRTLLMSCDLVVSDKRVLINRIHQVVVAHPELVPVLHEQLMEFEAVLTDAVARRLGVPAHDERPVVAAAVASALLRVTMSKQTAETDEPIEIELGQVFDALRALAAT